MMAHSQIDAKLVSFAGKTAKWRLFLHRTGRMPSVRRTGHFYPADGKTLSLLETYDC